MDIASLFVPMFVAMGFMSAGMGAVSLVGDRESKRRHMLRLAGVPGSVYVCGNAVFELCSTALPLAIVGTVAMFAFDASWFMASPTRVLGWLALIVTGPPATVMFSYAASHLFRTKTQAARVWPMILPAITVMPFVVVYILRQPGSSEENLSLSNTLSQAFCALPPYSFQEVGWWRGQDERRGGRWY